MEIIFAILGLTAGTIIGAAITWVLCRTRISAAQQELARFAPEKAALEERLLAKDRQITNLSQELEHVQEENKSLYERVRVDSEERATLKTRLEEERKATEEKLALVNEARQKLSDAFNSLAAEALKSNNESFLQLAKTTMEKFQETAKGDLESRQKAIWEMINPVKESLTKVDAKLHELEKERVSAYSSLTEQVKSLATTQVELKSETANLVRALRTPTVRGRWGEIQLKRVVEMAGMVEYCDFEEQVSTSTVNGRLQPDMIVRLPGRKNIVVDAKAPLEAYLNAIEAKTDEERNACLKNHARQIRDHMSKLSSKAYWDQFQPTPEFVTMFLPGEHFFGAALEVDPQLIEEGVKQKVIVASPTTLISLLRAVAYGWRQERVAESAQEISELAKDLYDRLVVFTNHLNKLGKDLDNAIGSYNKAVGSLESRVLVSARKFTDLGITPSKELPDLPPSEKSPRQIEAPVDNTI
jgi:DNA recombination protein RmuC